MTVQSISSRLLCLLTHEQEAEHPLQDREKLEACPDVPLRGPGGSEQSVQGSLNAGMAPWKAQTPFITSIIDHCLLVMLYPPASALLPLHPQETTPCTCTAPHDTQSHTAHACPCTNTCYSSHRSRFLNIHTVTPLCNGTPLTQHMLRPAPHTDPTHLPLTLAQGFLLACVLGQSLAGCFQ